MSELFRSHLLLFIVSLCLYLSVFDHAN